MKLLQVSGKTLLFKLSLPDAESHHLLPPEYHSVVYACFEVSSCLLRSVFISVSGLNQLQLPECQIPSLCPEIA